MSLNDTSGAGMSFSNNFNDMINQENMEAVTQAKQLTALNQQGEDSRALGKEQSDNVADYVSDGQDVFGLTLAGKSINDDMLKGIHEKGIGAYFKGEGKRLVGNFVKDKTGQSLDDITEQVGKVSDKMKSIGFIPQKRGMPNGGSKVNS